MKKLDRCIWQNSLIFLKTFQSLLYMGHPLPFLILRNFQRLKKNALRKNTLRKAPHFNARQLQQRCQPFLARSCPDWQRQGKLLVRAYMYQITAERQQRDCIYIAQHKKEYDKMRRYRGCRPLIHFPRIKASISHTDWSKMVRKLERILQRSSTPAFFQSYSFKRWMLQQIKKAMLDIHRWAYIYKKHRIAMVLYNSTVNHHGALACTAAKLRKIPVINIQHGVFGSLGHLPVNADLNAVWGESHKKFLMRHGAKDDSIIVTGPLFFRNLEKHKDAKRLSKLSGSIITVLVALQPLGKAFNLRMLQHVERAVPVPKKQFQIIYKLHPDQDHTEGTLLNKAVRSLHSQSEIVRHGQWPLEQLIDLCDIVITPYSSVAYEAALKKKPVLFYRKTSKPYYMLSQPRYFRNSKHLNGIFQQSLKRPFLTKWQSLQKLEDQPISGQKALDQLWRSLKTCTDAEADRRCGYDEHGGTHSS